MMMHTIVQKPKILDILEIQSNSSRTIVFEWRWWNLNEFVSVADELSAI